MSIPYGTEEWNKEYDAFVSERLQKPAPYIYFTPEWVALYEKAIQNDAAYKEAAKDWEGSVILHVLPDPNYGVDIDLYVFMDLWHGDCRYVRIVPTDAGEAGDFVISGALERWMQVARKQLDATKGMMQGKLKLKGDLPSIVRAVKAAQRLTDLAAEVGGKFPDELSPEEMDELKGVLKELKERFL